MRTILVTGAAGFIGSHVSEALVGRGDSVVAIDEFNDYYDPAIKRSNVFDLVQNDRFTMHEGDICDEDFVRSIFDAARPDVVVHLAARAGVRPSLEDPDLYNRVNVTGSQHVLDACRDSNMSHLVFASSSSVYGGITEVPFVETMKIDKPISPYATTKRMNELMGHVYHHIYGMKITFLRFFTVYGPRQRPDMAIHKFTKLMHNGQPIPMFGEGNSRRDYTFIDDIVSGVLCAIDKPFGYEIFNLGEQSTIELRELIDRLAKAMDVEVQIEKLPLQAGDVSITYADISKAREMLGYNPQYPLERGLNSFVRWYQTTISPR